MCVFSALKHGDVSIVFTSPEALGEKTLAMLKNLRHRVCLLAFDEVHCISEWLVMK